MRICGYVEVCNRRWSRLHNEKLHNLYQICFLTMFCNGKQETPHKWNVTLRCICAIIVAVEK